CDRPPVLPLHLLQRARRSPVRDRHRPTRLRNRREKGGAWYEADAAPAARALQGAPGPGSPPCQAAKDGVNVMAMRRSSANLGFVHRFRPGKGSKLTVLLLHGTGGNEAALIMPGMDL